MNKVTKNTFIKLCKEIFKFLEEDFDFEIKSIEQDIYGSYITYKNTTTAIRISFEPREGGMFILLSRLIEDKTPPYPVSIISLTDIYSFYLDDLLSIRAPSQKIVQEIEKLLFYDELENVMRQYAEVLKKYAGDILKGDFQVFGQLAEIVKKRSQKVK